jgi:hypothetical protein
MMEYQKTLNKERREDKKIGREDEQRALGAKAAKLKTDNQSIDLQMKESRERAETVQQDGQTRVAIPPVAGVVRAKPPAATETTAEACRLPEAICPEPCKLPPCP